MSSMSDIWYSYYLFHDIYGIIIEWVRGIYLFCPDIEYVTPYCKTASSQYVYFNKTAYTLYQKKP